MAITKEPYELSVWDEKLSERGQKIEIKRAIIGESNMSYLGRATQIKLQKKINGTNILTFQMPSKYFDSLSGDYIHNEFCDYLFNERKLKLKYKGEWLEFYIKNIQESKQFKSIMYSYTCQDAFIDELSRNGYGITFDTELYNNVEEIGIFSEEILEDSVWSYDASLNIGDFTEYSEEKLFKIPISWFSNLKGYKLKYEIQNANASILNPFSKEKRNLEMGDDKARELKYFWDNGDFDSGFPLIDKSEFLKTDGYIYVPFSQLNFCYYKERPNDREATEVPYIITSGHNSSYAIAPTTNDPSALIQFLVIPPQEEILIDESGLIVNKDLHYAMTVEEWNTSVSSNVWYNQEEGAAVTTEPEFTTEFNKAIGYDGYLDSINEVGVNFAKKISITNRTEPNISEEIDQYVTVYNNNIIKDNDLKTLINYPKNWVNSDIEYRLCSCEKTRMIVPQLARNLIQNGTDISSTSGWSVQKVNDNPNEYSSTLYVQSRYNSMGRDELQKSLLGFKLGNNSEKEYNTFLNFGITGQEVALEKGKNYVFSIKFYSGEVYGRDNKKLDVKYYGGGISFIIGEGSINSNGEYSIDSNDNSYFEISDLQRKDEYNLIFTPKEDILNPYFAISAAAAESDVDKIILIERVQLFEAYTKGKDFFDNGQYKYSGRELLLDYKSNNYITFTYEDLLKKVIFETDVVEGDAYGYQKYFIQQVVYTNETEREVFDTFKTTNYLKEGEELSTKYSEEEYKVLTAYLNLNKCPYYSEGHACDCGYPNSIDNKECIYQKYGYCPYLFKTQKHCRRIRTLNGEKSNRFNLTQELSKVFEVYPVYYIEHEENGKIKTDKATVDGTEYDRMRKKVFYMTEKGVENKLGFRYEKNLSNISRTLNSDEIVTKLYVEDVDSTISKTGMCSIKTAEDNPSKDSFIIDFSYYILKGLLDKDATESDLYGTNDTSLGYLKTLGYYNEKYDKLSNLIINLQDESYTELEANVEVNLTAIETAKQELNKLRQKADKYKPLANQTESETYQNYQAQITEQKNIYENLIRDTFMNQSNAFPPIATQSISTIEEFQVWLDGDGKEIIEKKEYIFGSKDGAAYGLMEQYCSEFKTIQNWKKERAKVLKTINKISLDFYQKYEPFLKEGTWSDSNYLSDNVYYFGAKEVAKNGAKPKVNYSISVVELSNLPDFEEYTFNIADTTYVEDIETFGINKKTGLPNRLKVIVSGITYDLDIPSQSTIDVQNYTSQFEDLFEQISASVQSLSFNENTYKRASNFTATKNVSKPSLQGALLENELTLLETEEKNIELDETGQKGSDINNHNNKYKLDGQGLFFSNDGGQHWSVGVTPNGINADYIKVGSLDASKVQIVDGEYLYFLWDKAGITAYRDPKVLGDENDPYGNFARFNKYGLSLVENNKIRLRAGYEYSGETGSDGDIVKEKTSIGGDRNIGFYLYNNKGEKIFGTETASLDGDESSYETAKLTLVGEIFATNKTQKSEEIKESGYNYSKEYQLSSHLLYSISEIQQSTFKEGNLENGKQYIVLNSGKSFNMTDLKKFLISKTGAEYYYKKDSSSELKITLTAARNTNDKFYVKNSLETIKIYSEYNREMTIGDDSFVYSYTIGDSTYYNLSSTTARVQICSYRDDEVKRFSTVRYATAQITYYDVSGGLTTVPATSKSFYRVDNKYYLNREEQTAETTERNGTVALYINNKNGWENAPDSTNGFNRLFCSGIAAEDGANINNIFTILKNGNLYMGGVLIDATSKDELDPNTISNLNSKVDVKDAYFRIENEKLYMDFNRIIDNEGNNLVDYIQAKVDSILLPTHSHEIKSLKIKYSNSNKNLSYIYFPTREDIRDYIEAKENINSEAQIFSEKPQYLFELMAKGETTFGETIPTDGKSLIKLVASGKVALVGNDWVQIECDGKTENTGLGVASGGSTTSYNGLYDVVDKG